MSARTRLVAAAAAAVLLGAAVASCNEVTFSLLGEDRIPSEPAGDGPVVGGLSGLAWDPACDLYWAVVDDRGLVAPPRLQVLRIDVADGVLSEGDATVVETVTLHDAELDTLENQQLDLEAVTLLPDGDLLLSSEGGGSVRFQPWIRRARRNGDLLDGLELPTHLLQAEHPRRGVRDNLAFEGMSLAPDGRTLMFTTENALVQDGPAADLGVASPSRLVVYDLVERRVVAEHVWRVEPVPDVPRPADAYRMNGISEIVALDRHHVLVLERSFSVGVGNTVRLFLGDLDGATDVAGLESIQELPAGTLRPVTKTQVADLAELGVDPDNLEGMAFGPRLADGRRVLVLVADNNFNPFGQVNQVVALAVGGLDPPFDPRSPVVTIGELQGAAQVSPFVGRCVDGVEGVVTATDRWRDGRAEAWLQAAVGDGDPATSEGLRLLLPADVPLPAAGAQVVAAGRVEDVAPRADLPVTSLVVRRLEVRAEDRPLPPPVHLGAGGVVVPAAVDLGPEFDPARDALDLYESLEGMRVELGPATVVGPTTRHGDLWVVPDGALPGLPRTVAGGILLTEDQPATARLALDDPLTVRPPPLAVGDRLTAPVTGILSWAWGGWRLLVTGGWPAVESRGRRPQVVDLPPGGGRLTIATVNLENLSAAGPPERFARFGRLIADDLGGPAVVALQEVQDDSGATDDGTVSAARTLALLADAVAAAGGPRYRAVEVPPVDGADGGRPGGNIRPAILVDPDRARVVERGAGEADHATAVTAGPSLRRSPGLIAPDDAAFVDSRKPLAVELEVAGRPLFLVDLHLVSKGADDPQMGRRQPPRLGSEPQRVAQARLVAGFVAEILAADPQAAVVVLGDLNEHEWRPPVAELTGAGLVDLIREVPAGDRYTFVFQGRSQVLDHVLLSPALAAGAAVDVVHLNAGLPESQRASDHDPVVAALALPGLP